MRTCKEIYKHTLPITIIGIGLLLVAALLTPAFAAITNTTSVFTPNVTSPKAPFVLSSGYVDPTTGQATITPGCPTGFVAYATLSAGNMDATASTLRTFSKYYLCVFTASTSTITIGVGRVANYSTITTHSNSGLYMGFYNWAYGAGTSTNFPSNTTEISDDTGNDSTNIKNISYVLYCYPSGTEPTSVPLCT